MCYKIGISLLALGVAVAGLTGCADQPPKPKGPTQVPFSNQQKVIYTDLTQPLSQRVYFAKVQAD